MTDPTTRDSPIRPNERLPEPARARTAVEGIRPIIERMRAMSDADSRLARAIDGLDGESAASEGAPGPAPVNRSHSEEDAFALPPETGGQAFAVTEQERLRCEAAHD